MLFQHQQQQHEKHLQKDHLAYVKLPLYNITILMGYIDQSWERLKDTNEKEARQEEKETKGLEEEKQTVDNICVIAIGKESALRGAYRSFVIPQSQETDSPETRAELAVLRIYVENQAILEPILLYRASKCKQPKEQGSDDCLLTHIFIFL